MVNSQLRQDQREGEQVSGNIFKQKDDLLEPFSANLIIPITAIWVMVN